MRPLSALIWLGLCTAGAQPLTVMTWNLNGNGATNWTTNEPQVQAIGRVLKYLQPDVVTFNEVPYPHTNDMAGVVAAYLPGYALAISSGTDNFICSAVASRYPINRAQKWLDGAPLSNFGYDGNFTRDLFEAEVNVPFYTLPLHVFTTHLKATGAGGSNDYAKRGAESLAISNFLVTNFLPTKSSRPYFLSGDMNEDATNSSPYSRDPISNLVNAATGLRLTTPENPFTHNVRTWSVRTNLTQRLDYVMPSGQLFSNLASGQAFRTDKLVPLPGSLFSNDSQTASDHMPVLLVFNNPFETPFLLTSLTFTGQTFRLAWRATPGQRLYVQASTNLSNWAVVATNLTSNSINYTSSAASPVPARYFRVTK